MVPKSQSGGKSGVTLDHDQQRVCGVTVFMSGGGKSLQGMVRGRAYIIDGGIPVFPDGNRTHA